MRRLWASVAVALCALHPVFASASGPTWERWKPVAGVFDLGGPRSDGAIVVAGAGALYLMTPAGDLTPYAGGAHGYHDDAGSEPYLAVSPGARLPASGCSFARDDTYVLRLHKPIGVTRISAAGDQVSAFAVVGLPAVNSIAFDTVGAFGHRLVVTGPAGGGKTAIAAIDCTGAVEVLTRSAPVFEGGIVVAPATFGAFAGGLIAPDELSGRIYAIASDGTVSVVAGSGLRPGPDAGVESLGFVPDGFSLGGALYYSDRRTAGSPHPGSDNVLRMSSADLVAAGERDGDLLVANEGGAQLVDVRCAATCQVTTVVATATAAHGEGHLVFTVNPRPSPTPTAAPAPSPSPVIPPARSSVPVAPLVALVGGILAALAVAVVAASRRRT